MRSAKKHEPACRRLWHAAGAVTALLALLVLSASSPAFASGGEIVYNVLLSGDQEVPPAATAAIGGGQLRIDTAANTVTYHITFAGLTGAATAAHIHGPADPGTNGGVLHTLPTSNPMTGVWNYAEANEGDILDGKTYVNIHTGMFPAGEVRGQVVPLNCFIDDQQISPPPGSSATGWGVFTIDTAANNLNYYIFYSGLSSPETAAHIHGLAGYGGGGGVLEGLPLGSPKVGTWNYPEGIDEMITDGLTYVNIHTENFQGGEIRGQIVPLVVPIDGTQEVPPSGSPGAGIGMVAIDKVNDMLGFDITFAGLAGAETAAHIHGYAPPGANAGVLFSLPAGPRKLAVWNYPAGDEVNILDGLTYINIHTNVNPGGEIRGQVQGFDCIPITAVSDPAAPHAFDLFGGEPNPFDENTTLRFRLDEDAVVLLRIFDSQGRLVRTLLARSMAAGDHRVTWDGKNAKGQAVPNGVYHYLMETPREKASGRLTIVR